jgi:hypothetical protein
LPCGARPCAVFRCGFLFPTQSDYRAPALAAVKATRCAGVLRPTLTVAAGRADAITSAPGERRFCPTRGNDLGRALPFPLEFPASKSGTIDVAAISARDRGRIEPAVSGGFGSQFSRRTIEKRRHVAPAHPAGKGCCQHHFPPEMRTAHRLSFDYECIRPVGSPRRPYRFGRIRHARC